MGFLITVASIAGILVYGWLLFVVTPQIILQVTAFVAVTAILGIMAWIGYTLATTAPPAPIKGIELESTERGESAAQPKVGRGAT